MNRQTRKGDGVASGLTLVELMVAMAIFSALGVMSYRALDSITAAQIRLDGASQRWRELARAVQRIETSLHAVLSAPPALGQSVIGFHNGHATGIWFWRTDARAEVFRQAIEWRPSGELVMRSWAGREAIGTDQQQLLLTRVRAVRWVFWLKGQAVSAWPVPGATPGQPPDAVGLELDLDDLGVVQRLWLLRW